MATSNQCLARTNTKERHKCTRTTKLTSTGYGSAIYCKRHLKLFPNTVLGYQTNHVFTRFKRKCQIEEHTNWLPNVLIQLIITYDDSYIGELEAIIPGPFATISNIASFPDGRIVCSSVNYAKKFETLLSIITPTDGNKPYEIIATDHTEIISCLAILNTNPTRIITGSFDHTLKIWNEQTRLCEHTLIGHTNAILCVSILSKFYIISGSSDKTLRIWDSHTGECLHILTGHTDSVTCIGLSSNGDIISGSKDKRILIWKKTTNTEFTFQLLIQETQSIKCLAILPDDRLVTVAGDDNSSLGQSYRQNIKVWARINESDDLGSYLCEYILKGHKNLINCILILSNEKIISGSADKEIRIWNINRLRSQSIYPIFIESEIVLITDSNSIKNIIQMPNQRILSYSASDPNLRLWQ